MDSPTRELPTSESPMALRRPGAPSLSERFRSITLLADDVDAAWVARRMAEDTLREWALPGLTDDVALCVSELVGNAVHHATPDGWLESIGGDRRVGVALWAWPKWLCAEVSDEDSTPPMLPAAASPEPGPAEDFLESLPADSGRGLFIVQSLADATWWAPRDFGGKSVFCRFNLADRAES